MATAKLFTLTCLFIYAVDNTDAAGSLTSIPDTVINGVLTVCPGTSISLICIHDNVAGEFTRWQVGSPVTCVRPVIHNPPAIGDTCGQFNIINVSDISGPTVTSTAQTTVTEALNGAVVECLAGALSSSPQVGNITISVIETSGNLTSASGTVTNSALIVCPGTAISLTCTHDNVLGENSRWTANGLMTCDRIINHIPPVVNSDSCGPFTVIDISDVSGSTLTSTAQTTVTEALNGVVVECIGGSLSTSPQVGNITISIIAGSPSAPIIDVPIWYTVDTATSGTAVITSTSGSRIAGIVLNGSAIRASGSEQEPPAMVKIAGDAVAVSDLDYDQLYVVTITTGCPGVAGSSTAVSITLNTAVLSLTQPVPSITCSDPSLPVQLEWNIDQRVQSSTDPMVTPLTPPIIGLPVVSYTSTGGGMGSSFSSSPYTLSEPVRNDTYIFNVSVTNAAGSVSRESFSILAAAFEVDESTVTTLNCLSFNIRPECSEDVSTGDFSVRLEYGFNCRTTSVLTTTTTVITSQSTCLSVGTGSVNDFCYRITLLYRGTVVDTKTNMEDFRECSIAGLTVGSGVTYTLSSTDVNSEVPHLTAATLECNSGALTGASRMTCIDGIWRDNKVISCSMLSFEAAIALTFVLTFLLTLVLGISIGVVSVLVYNKCKRGTDQSSSQPTELTSMSGPVYEEPVDFKPDPHTAGNVAYGHVQPLRS